MKGRGSPHNANKCTVGLNESSSSNWNINSQPQPPPSWTKWGIVTQETHSGIDLGSQSATTAMLGIGT